MYFGLLNCFFLIWGCILSKVLFNFGEPHIQAQRDRQTEFLTRQTNNDKMQLQSMPAKKN